MLELKIWEIGRRRGPVRVRSWVVGSEDSRRVRRVEPVYHLQEGDGLVMLSPDRPEHGRKVIREARKPAVDVRNASICWVISSYLVLDQSTVSSLLTAMIRR